jgi:hypothetical protein
MSNTSLSIQLEFGNCCYLAEGDWLPTYKGIYVAYAGSLNGDKFTPRQLLYIGKSSSTPNGVGGRIKDHLSADHGDWQRYMLKSEVIAYYCAKFDGPRLEDVEAALIYHNQPVANTQNMQGVDLQVEQNLSGTTIYCRNSPLLEPFFYIP